MRRALPLLVCACALALARAAAADDTTTDDQGRTFRVRFDPGSELRLGAVGGVWAAGSDHQLDPAIVTGLAYRAASRTGFKHDNVSWQLDHRAFWGTVRPWGGTVKDVPEGDLTLYSGTYLRHTDEPFLMLPTSPPKRMYFPFDIGVEAEAGRARLQPASGGRPERLRIGVARASVLLDPLRSGKPGNSLPIGFGLRYDIDLQGTPELDTRSVVHRVAPMSEVSLAWRYQDGRGLTTWEVRGSWFPHWSSRGGWQTDSIEASAELGRVLIAVNDTPVRAILDAEYCRYPGDSRDEVAQDGRATAGLQVGWQLK